MSAWLRAAHVLASMLALGLILLFAASGLLMNREAGEGEPAAWTKAGKVPAELAAAPDRDRIAEALRREFGVAGLVDSFEPGPSEIRVVFVRPGRRAEALVRRPGGETIVSFESRGLVGALADLHRGKSPSRAWRFFIDAAAILLALSALTGIWICIAGSRWRVLGIASLAAGLAALALGYFLLVP